MDRKGWGRWILIVAVALLGGLWIEMSRAQSGTPMIGRGARVDFLAPDFTLNNLDGDPVSLSDYQGQVVILNFWATWCPPCREEMPTLEEVYRDRVRDGLVVLGVNQMEPADRVREFLESLNLTFPVVLDTRGEVARLYRVRAYPTTYFIDRGGVIRDMVIGGPMSEALLRSKVEALLEE
ncbi:MAG TPA: TlpA family protein disulfide reductase [Caldilineae bacterium]|jgi:peroxiredoxin|nr:TlpA family protein disulfide reductase [Caldilineae bacterium]